MRNWLNDARSYIEPVKINEVMRALGIGHVIESKDSKFKAGDLVRPRMFTPLNSPEPGGGGKQGESLLWADGTRFMVLWAGRLTTKAQQKTCDTESRSPLPFSSFLLSAIRLRLELTVEHLLEEKISTTWVSLGFQASHPKRSEFWYNANLQE